MNRVSLLLLAALMLALAGCKSSDETKGDKDTQAAVQQKPDLPPPGIAPGRCRLVATVVSVDPTLSVMAGDPCGTAPCLAVVRIQEVLGYGSSFGSVLGKGQEVNVRFRYTLKESLQPKLPGLDVGSVFQAEVEMAGPVMMGETRVADYLIESYVVREPH